VRTIVGIVFASAARLSARPGRIGDGDGFFRVAAGAGAGAGVRLRVAAGDGFLPLPGVVGAALPGVRLPGVGISAAAWEG
jgi:hypothetical protein